MNEKYYMVESIFTPHMRALSVQPELGTLDPLVAFSLLEGVVQASDNNILGHQMAEDQVFAPGRHNCKVEQLKCTFEALAEAEVGRAAFGVDVESSEV